MPAGSPAAKAREEWSDLDLPEGLRAAAAPPAAGPAGGGAARRSAAPFRRPAGTGTGKRLRAAAERLTPGSCLPWPAMEPVRQPPGAPVRIAIGAPLAAAGLTAVLKAELIALLAGPLPPEATAAILFAGWLTLSAGLILVLLALRPHVPPER